MDNNKQRADQSEQAAGNNNQRPAKLKVPEEKKEADCVERTPWEIEIAAQKYRRNEGKRPLKPEKFQADHITETEDDEWIKEVRTKVNKPRGRAHASRPCTIFKVQENIVRCNQGAYTPFLISIGPYHHLSLCSNSNVKALENHKWMCLRRLLFRHRSRRSATELLDKCLLAMKSLDTDVRSCYSESLDSHFDAHRLALAMLLDGGFILHLLLKRQNLIDDHVSNKVRKDNDDDDDQVEDGEILMLELGEGDEDMEGEPLLPTLLWQFVLYDLLKLENQIPFFVLTTLFDLLKYPGDEGVDLVNIAFRLFRRIHPHSTPKNPLYCL